MNKRVTINIVKNVLLPGSLIGAYMGLYFNLYRYSTSLLKMKGMYSYVVPFIVITMIGIIMYLSNNKNNQFVGYDKIGEKGKPAEEVGKEAAIGFIDENISQTPVDSHLGDMLIPILALIPNQSSYRISKITSHIETNLFISKLITGCNFSIKKYDDNSALVNIKGETSYSDNFSLI